MPKGSILTEVWALANAIGQEVDADPVLAATLDINGLVGENLLNCCQDWTDDMAPQRG